MSERADRLLVEDVTRLPAGARVLDLPTGDGHLSERLAARGIGVVPADLFPERCRFSGADVVRADMNARLPFDDGQFDGVVCQEGIEHLENPASFLRECRRILEDGGKIWLTTPNFMDLSSRLSNLLTGLKSFHADYPNEETTVWGGEGARLYYGHAFTLPFFQIRFLLRLCQFDEIELRGIGRSPTAVVLWPFVRLVSGLLISRTRGGHAVSKKRRRVSRELYGELRSQALSPALLLHRKILVRATLREGSFAATRSYEAG